ncbi:MAG: HAMP domain-containing histidine kinase [Treponema sp.]|jgi:signal transduction histidine kinase|nr:HAMP domain-containing histidine kinase [Treponema sp.]
MKIQTQFHLLITGIIMVPFLTLLSHLLLRTFQERNEQPEIPVYEDTVLAEHISRQDWEAISRFASRSHGDFTVFRDDFMVLYSSIPEFKTGSFETIAGIVALFEAEHTQYSYSFESPLWLEGHEYLLIRWPIKNPGPVKPPLFPLISSIIFVVILAVFAIVMSLGIARSITKSVLVLEEATRRIASGELDLAVDVRGSNEITSLTSSLNHMRAALKEAENRRYRFIMGITHDLKTPLALIRGYTEAIRDGLTDDPLSRSSATDIIIAKADQLEGMIQDLIELVRMDTGEWHGRLQKVGLRDFLLNFARRIALDAELFQHRVVVALDLPASLLVPLDERLTIRALENLVNNAIRYTPAGTRIRLAAEAGEKAITIRISDNGPGIAPKDLPHIFETFYRGSASRQEQGMGLGLAVVKWVAESHGWSIGVSSTAQETCFTLTIPRQDRSFSQIGSPRMLLTTS